MSKDQQIGKAAMNMTSNIYMNSTTKYLGFNAINPDLKNMEELKQKAQGGFLNANQKSKNQDVNKSSVNKDTSTSRIAPTKLSQLGSSALFQGLDSPQNKNRVLSGNRNSFSKVQSSKQQTPKDKSTQQKSKPQHIQRSHGRNLMKNDSSQVSVTRYKTNNSTNNEAQSKNIVIQQFHKNQTQMKDDFGVRKKSQNKPEGEHTDRSQPPQSKKSGGYVYKPLGANKKQVEPEVAIQQKKVQPEKSTYNRKNIEIQQLKVQQKKEESPKHKKSQINILKKQLSPLPLNIQNNKPSLLPKKSPEINQSSSNQSGYVYKPPKKASQKSITFQQSNQKDILPAGNTTKIQRKTQNVTASNPEPIVNKIISPKNNESGNKFERKSNSITQNNQDNKISKQQIKNSKQQVAKPQLLYPKTQSRLNRNRVNQQLNLQVNVDTNYFKLQVKGGSTQRSRQRQKSQTDRQKNKLSNKSNVNLKVNVNANQKIISSNVNAELINSNNVKQSVSGYQYKKPFTNQTTIQQKQTVQAQVILVQNQRKYPPSRLSKQQQERPNQQKVVQLNTNNNSQQTKPVYQYKKPPVKVIDNSNVSTNVNQSLSQNKNNNVINNKVDPSPSISPEKVYNPASYRTKALINTKVDDDKKKLSNADDEPIKKQVTPPKKPVYSYKPKTKEELLQEIIVVKPQMTKIVSNQVNKQAPNKIEKKTPQKINRNNNKTTINNNNSQQISATTLQNPKKQTSTYIKPKTKQELIQVVVKPAQKTKVEKRIQAQEKTTSINSNAKTNTTTPINSNNSHNNQSGYVYRPPKKSQKFTKPLNNNNDQSRTIANQSKLSQTPIFTFNKIPQNKVTIQEVTLHSNNNNNKNTNIQIKKPTYKYGQKINTEKVVLQQKKEQQQEKKGQQVRTKSLNVEEKKQELVSKPIMPSYGKKQPILTVVNKSQSPQKIQSSQVSNIGKGKSVNTLTKQPIKTENINILEKTIKRPNPLFCLVKMMYKKNLNNCFKTIQKKNQQIKIKQTKIVMVLATSISTFCKNIERKLLHFALNQLKKKVFSQFNKQVETKKQEKMNQLKLKSQEVLTVLIESVFKSKLRQSFDTLLRIKTWKKSIFHSCQSFNKIIIQKEHDLQVISFKKLKLYNSIVKSNVEDVLNIFKTSNGKNLKDLLHKLFSTAYPIKNLKSMSRPGSERSISISRVSGSPIVPIKGVLSNSPSQKSIASRSISLKGQSNNIKEKVQKLQKQISQKTTNHQKQMRELSIRKENIRKDIKKSNTQYQQKKGQNKQIKQLFQKSQGKDFELAQDTFSNQHFQRLESLSELYTNLYKIEKDEVDVSQIKENLPRIDAFGEKCQVILREWQEIRRNLTLKNDINKYQGVQPKEYKATTSLLQEQEVAQKLLRSYIRERYLWQWVRKTANALIY